MSEKLCLQWNDFKANVNSAFGRLRDDKDFTDVTLACEDGQQMEAHKVILAASSPSFENILQRNKHPHPLIFLKGFQSQDLLAILDFLYFGEAKVFQENLDSFLAIAEELKLKGLEEKEKSVNPKPIHNTKEPSEISTTYNNIHDAEETSKDIAISNQFSDDMQALDETVKTMMEKGRKKIPHGKKKLSDGSSKLEIAYICKVCGKEGQIHVIRNHIEGIHLEGTSIPCDSCGKISSSRVTLRLHKANVHKK